MTLSLHRDCSYIKCPYKESLVYVECAGTLPSTWGGNGSFPNLKQLHLGGNSLSGTLPLQWGSSTAFQQLTNLTFLASNISGDANHT